MQINLSSEARSDLRWFTVAWLTHMYDRADDLDVEFMEILVDLFNGEFDLKNYEHFCLTTSSRGLDVISGNIGVPLEKFKEDNFYVENRVNVFAREVREQVEKSLSEH